MEHRCLCSSVRLRPQSGEDPEETRLVFSDEATGATDACRSQPAKTILHRTKAGLRRETMFWAAAPSAGIIPSNINSISTPNEGIMTGETRSHRGAQIQAAARNSNEPHAITSPWGNFIDFGLEMPNSSRA